MAVIAITPIQHGESDGTVKNFKVGDDVSSLGEDAVRNLVESGSAVETGKNKKYASPVTGEGATAPVDEDTQKRDEIIAKALAGDDPSPAAANAAGSPDANEGGDQTLAASAAESKKK